VRHRRVAVSPVAFHVLHCANLVVTYLKLPNIPEKY